MPACQLGHFFTFRVTATDNVSNGASTEALARFPRVTKYYYHGGRRVAQRRDGVVYYLHGDHLGSTSLVTGQTSNVVARQLFRPYGETRWQAGTLPTDFGFAGQREDGSTGLLFMHARYYDPALGRFVSADTMVPGAGNPQAFNRYSYAVGNPVRYSDPSGHRLSDPADPEHDPTIRRQTPPPASEPSQSPGIIYVGLAARELGPHYVAPFWPEDHPKYGQSMLDDLFSPWPGDSRASLIESGTYGEALYDIYGGPDRLHQIVIDACKYHGCNNPAISDNWSRYSPETKEYLTSKLYGGPQNITLATFLLEVKADPQNPYNYEPLYMEELQRERSRELIFAQWKYVNQYYLGHRKEWWESNFGIKGGKASP